MTLKDINKISANNIDMHIYLTRGCYLEALTTNLSMEYTVAYQNKLPIQKNTRYPKAKMQLTYSGRNNVLEGFSFKVTPDSVQWLSTICPFPCMQEEIS